MELSRTKGFYRVTMDELAAEAGISKRTLYRYFRSKDEIIEATINNFMAEVAARIEEFFIVHRKPEEIVAYMLEILLHVGSTIGNPLVLDDLRQHYPHLWKKIDEFRMQKAQAIIQSKFFLDEGNRSYVRDIDTRIVTTAVLASVRAVANPDFIINNGLTFNDTIKQLLEFFQYGFMKERK